MTTDLETIPSSTAEYQYSYRASMMGAPYQFTLTPDRLEWQVGRRRGQWPYERIARIRLSYRPMPLQSNCFRADISADDGHRIRVMSATWRSIVVMETQGMDYREFILELHRRIAAAGGRPRLLAGTPRIVFGVGAFMLGVLGMALAVLLIRALDTGHWSGAAFIFAFAALTVWQIGGFMRRNRPGDYSLDAVPERLLPDKG